MAGRPRSLQSGAFVALLTAALACLLAFVTLWRYRIFRTDVDLGIFTQVIGSLGHGFSSTAEGGVNHLLVHWSPIVAFGWPFLRAFGPAGLQVFQALLVAATLIPIWGLARARFGAAAAFGVVAVASLYPTLWGNGVGDFHEMAFVPLLSAALVYALDRRKWTLGIACALLLACTKEDQFVTLAWIGAAIALTRRGDREQRRFGATVFFIALAGAFAYFGVVRNLLQPHVPYLSFRFFDWSGEPSGPAALGAALLPRVRYVAIVLVPLAFLPCVSRYGLFLVPGLVEILASHEPVTLAPGAHYSALLTGYALAAFVDGLSRIERRRPRALPAALAVAAVASLAVEIFASPMEYWYYLYRVPNARDALLDARLRALPAGAGVGAEGEVFSHLGLDPAASIGMNGQQWFVYDATHYSTRWHDVDQPAVRRLLAERAYTVVDDAGGVVVLRRASKRR